MRGREGTQRAAQALQAPDWGTDLTWAVLSVERLSARTTTAEGGI